MADNKVYYGLKNLHVAFRDQDDSGGDLAYEAPIPIPGVIEATQTPLGDANTLFADDGPYFDAIANNGYDIDLDVALIPPAVLNRMLGYGVDGNGAEVEDADALPNPFALMFELNGNVQNRRYVYYECTASRPTRADKTRETAINPVTDKLKVNAKPVEINGTRTPRVVLQATDANTGVDGEYTTFFETVYLPVPAV